VPLVPFVPLVPLAPLVPAYPEATIPDKPQFIELVVAVAVSEIFTVAAHKVKPALGADVIVCDHPDGSGVNELVAHVYVEVPTGLAGIVIAHLKTVGRAVCKPLAPLEPFVPFEPLAPLAVTEETVNPLDQSIVDVTVPTVTTVGLTAVQS
jgi:hypothetical protein